MEQSLDDVLNGAEPGTVEAEIASTEVIEEAEVEDIKGEETTGEKEEPEAVEKPATENKDEEPWTKAAYLDEKRKRQELQRRLEEREAVKEPVKAPDIFENQDQYTDFLRNEIGGAVANTRAEMSEFYARDKYGSDVVDQKFEKYKELEAENPQLRAELAKSPMPWVEMVKKVEAAEKLEKLQDVDKLEAELRAEIEAKVRKELEGEAEHESKKQNAITPSLAAKRAAGGDNDPLHQSLDEILGR